MKTSTLPAVRVTPEVRALVESVLREGETLSMFIEDSLREQAQLRQNQDEFIKRGIKAGQRVRETGIYVTADESIAQLRAMLKAKRKKEGLPA